MTITIFGCSAKGNGRVMITQEGRKITLLNTAKDQTAEKAEPTDEFIIEKIDKLEGMRGEDWLEGDDLVITKENTALKPVHVADSMENIRNLYTYNTGTGKETLLYKENDYLYMPIVSPDKKHILVQTYKDGELNGLILDENGNVVITVSEKNTQKGLHLSYSNAKWVNNDLVIVPTSGEGVCLIPVNSDIEILDGIDLMQTDTAVMAGEKIYYISTDRNLMSYDVNTGAKTVFKENIYDFALSPKKDKFALEKKISDSKTALIITDLMGNELSELTEGKSVFAMSWSPDQTKIAYLKLDDTESENGLYIMKLEDRESLYVSPDFIGIDNGLKWNNAGNKVLASIPEVKDMKLIDNSYIISLK
jgi:TolB protein